MSGDMQRIEHKGVVCNIAPSMVSVMVISHSACEKCHAKSYCSPSSDTKNKIINVECNNTSFYKIGDEVTVYISNNSGMYAVVLAYIIPVVILLVSIFIASYNNIEDNVSALISLLFLVIYFIILYTFRRKLSKRISVKLEK